jgi:hypothetical protein
MGNLMVRLHLRLRLTIILFFAFSFALLWFVRSNTCSSYLTTWGGMLPLQVKILHSPTQHFVFPFLRCRVNTQIFRVYG